MYHINMIMKRTTARTVQPIVLKALKMWAKQVYPSIQIEPIGKTYPNHSAFVELSIELRMGEYLTPKIDPQRCQQLAQEGADQMTAILTYLDELNRLDQQMKLLKEAEV